MMSIAFREGSRLCQQHAAGNGSKTVLFGVLCDVAMLVAAYVRYYIYRHAVDRVLLIDKSVILLRLF